MGLITSLFGNKDRKQLIDLIKFNADIIEKPEKRTRHDSEYLAICLLLDDLQTRPNGRKGYLIVMDMLLKEYSQHHSDVITYLGVQTGVFHLTPEAEEQMAKRHRVSTKERQ